MHESTKGLEGDWDGVLRGRGCPPPTGTMPERPIRVCYGEAEIEARLEDAARRASGIEVPLLYSHEHPHGTWRVRPR